jgi:hypothetical protein
MYEKLKKIAGAHVGISAEETKMKFKIAEIKSNLKLAGATDEEIETLETEYGKWDEFVWELIYLDYTKNGSFSEKSNYALSKQLLTETILNRDESVYLMRWAIDKGFTSEQLKLVIDIVTVSGRPVTVYSVTGMIEKILEA